MKKEIVINASKDRARIAIVEDGRLAELYVEHPDNVRTLGNIYLGKVKNVLPQMSAAFVDIGQKQDAFLHFSDLTDNAAQLFAMAGEDIPGLESGVVLSQAPQKRVADDEDEPDVEDTLEVEDAPDESKTARTGRSRSRRRRRRGGRGRGRSGGQNGRAEEEEEQEERRLSHVIDLTQKTGSVRPKRRPKASGDSAPTDAPDTEEEPDAKDAASGDGASGDAEAPKRSRSRRRKAEAPADDAPETSATETANADAPEADASADAPAAKKPKRTRSRSRRKKADSAPEASGDTGEAEAKPDAKAEADAPEATAEEKPKRTRSRSRKKKADSAPTTEAPEASGDDAEPGDAEPEPKTPVRRREPSVIDLTSGSSRRRPARREAPDADAASGDVASADAAEDAPKDDEAPSRSRRGCGRRSDAPEADAATTDATPGDDARDSSGDDAPRSRRRGRGRRRSSDEATADAASDASSDDDAPEADGRPARSRGRSRTASGEGEKESRGRSRGRDTNGDRDADRSSDGRSRGGRSGGRSSSKSAKGNGRAASGAKVPTKPEELLKRGGRVLVKITKEPISAKGSRVSTDISLAGRFLVLVPAADYVAVSKKIESSKERRRLRALATSLKPHNCGVIVRTVAGGRDAKALDQDLRLLIGRWNKIERKLAEEPRPPVLLHEDLDMVSSIMRDLFTSDFDRILVDDPRLHRKLQNYVKAVSPQMADRVVMHKSNQAVFRSVGIEKQVAEAFSEKVYLKSGGYLIIEHTEAMHVIDVNSGRAGRGKRRAEENLLAVNLESAREIARQLRLRDLGGIICVDFIDLRYDRDRRKVTDAIKKEFAKDRAVTKVIGMSDFGVMQITRQRLRPSITAQDDADGMDAQEAAGATEIQQPERHHPEPEASGDDAQDARAEDARAEDAEREEASGDRRSRGRGRGRSSREGARQRPEPAEDIGPAELAERVRAWLAHYRDAVDERYARRPIVVSVHPLLGSYLRRGFPSPLTRLRFRLRNLPFRLADDPKVDPLAFEVSDEKSGRSLLSKYDPSGD